MYYNTCCSKKVEKTLGALEMLAMQATIIILVVIFIVCQNYFQSSRCWTQQRDLVVMNAEDLHR